MTHSNPIQTVVQLLKDSQQLDYIGEPISQLQHALQAAYFATKAKASEIEILASLFHDVGHLCDRSLPQMEGLGTVDHETVGARFLNALGFDPQIAELISDHVEAKRYLTWKNPHYLNSLSEASRGTLKHQGGPMSEAEARSFEKDPLFKEKLRIRSFDEKAKQVDLDVPGIDHYIPMMERHLLN